MVKNIIENDIKIDFEAGKTLLRIFDKENQCFIDNATDIFFPYSEFNIIQISYHLKNQLKEIPKTELSIEYEFLKIFDKNSENFITINLNQIYNTIYEQEKLTLYLDNDTIITLEIKR